MLLLFVVILLYFYLFWKRKAKAMVYFFGTIALSPLQRSRIFSLKLRLDRSFLGADHEPDIHF